MNILIAENHTVAKIYGEQVIEFPVDLFIPPDALRVLLETFEGPLDLLLYLIKKQNFNILDIPIAEITRQYIQYMDLMIKLNFDLAADYLVMAAMLAEIKSRLLLPRPQIVSEPEDDPRAELVRRLQEYECFQKAAQKLDTLTRIERDVFLASVEVPEFSIMQLAPKVDCEDLLAALKSVLQRAKLFTSHKILNEALSVRERMTELLTRLSQNRTIEFKELFNYSEGRIGIVVTLLAMLELIRQAAIEIDQEKPFAAIYLKLKRADYST